jgi:hypothetical protein
MNDLIEKNRGLLELYYFAASIIGWILICMTPFLFILQIYSWSNFPVPRESQFYGMLNSSSKIILNYLMFGIVILCIARIIKYLHSEEKYSGWFLTHMEKLLYIYAILIIASIFIEYKNPSMSPPVITLKIIATYVLPLIIFKGAQVLIIMGIAHILHRIIPIIEESKKHD